ncbi:hypothetical protein VNO78_21581 [Psophocarpus tetragonolobus]|uniref:Protein kinase domain-containing protein n=1 Tax=Psophocarpus tetragonolobus TaxID=3891 RepID=A0AAN9XHT6_PSOTE
MLLLVLNLLVQPQTGASTVVDSNTFSFVTFTSESCTNGELLCMGSATAGNGYLSLTPEPRQGSNSSSSLSSTTNFVGRVLYPYPVNVWPAIISTTFTVRITPSENSTSSGDGMALVFAQDNRPSPNASYGSYLGMFDQPTQGVFQQIAVEMDTFMNEFDPDGNHIGIVTTSITNPLASESLNSTGIDLKSGRDIEVKVDYDGWNKMIFVSVGYSESQLKSILNHSINLAEIFPSSIYVGFIASTGTTFPESHQVLNWVFTSVPLPILSVEHTRFGTIKTILVIFMVCLFPVIWIATSWRRRYLRSKKKEDIESLSNKAADIPKVFTYKQLSRATCNFSQENLLGKGAFGSVYKGIMLDSGKTVAVKKISATSKQGEREFLAEICTIGRLRHKNLVKLQGWLNWLKRGNSFVDCVWNLHSQNALLECVDKRLENKFHEEEAKRALMVGLACLHPDSMFRPRMRKVVNIFQNQNEPLMELPGVRPTGVYVSVSSSTTTSNSGSRGEFQHQSSTKSSDGKFN